MALWISHRGESVDAPENTAAAFRLAMERGTDGMETDIHLTSDGVLVCSHDSCTGRCCGGKALTIEETPFSELRKLDASNGMAEFKGEPIPTFVEALEILEPGRQFYVEIKKNDLCVMEAMMDAVDKSGCSREQIVMISFHEDVVRAFKRKYPEQKALWLASFPKDDGGRYLYGREYCMEVLLDIKADGIDACADPEFVDAEFVKTVHEAGMYFAVWVLDTEDACDKFLSFGIDSVTSNCAAKMMKSRR